MNLTRFIYCHITVCFSSSSEYSHSSAEGNVEGHRNQENIERPSIEPGHELESDLQRQVDYVFLENNLNGSDMGNALLNTNENDGKL